MWSEELKLIDPDSGHQFETKTMFWTYVSSEDCEVKIVRILGAVR